MRRRRGRLPPQATARRRCQPPAQVGSAVCAAAVGVAAEGAPRTGDRCRPARPAVDDPRRPGARPSGAVAWAAASERLRDLHDLQVHDVEGVEVGVEDEVRGVADLGDEVDQGRGAGGAAGRRRVPGARTARSTAASLSSRPEFGVSSGRRYGARRDPRGRPATVVASAVSAGRSTSTPVRSACVNATCPPMTVTNDQVAYRAGISSTPDERAEASARAEPVGQHERRPKGHRGRARRACVTRLCSAGTRFGSSLLTRSASPRGRGRGGTGPAAAARSPRRRPRGQREARGRGVLVRDRGEQVGDAR